MNTWFGLKLLLLSLLLVFSYSYFKPDFLTCDLVDMVASNLGLYDKDYFGLSFIDST